MKIIDEESREAAVVDPGDDQEVATAVEENNASLTKVLYTSFCAANNPFLMLRVKFKDLQVYGADNRIEGLTRKVKHDDTFNIGKLQVRCLATPLGMGGDICYHITGDQDNLPAVFTGDTLCVAGYSDLFYNSPEQVYALLMTLGSLPDETKVYCVDDYCMEERLKFAQRVEPENQIIRYKLEWVHEQVKEGNRIVSTTIQDEKLTNPFMRLHEQSVMDYTGQLNPIETMISLRQQWSPIKSKANCLIS